MIGLLFIDPAVYLLHHFAKPHVLVTSPGIMLPEEIKPALSYVRAHERPTDMIYIFRDALPAYEYYSDIEHIHDNNLLPGIAEGSDSKDYVEDLGRLRGRQVLGHVLSRKRRAERRSQVHTVLSGYLGQTA